MLAKLKKSCPDCTESSQKTYLKSIRALSKLAGNDEVPATHRWIPKAMNVQYLQKATTSLRATARIDVPDFDAITEGVDVVVPVSVTDRNGVEVVHADITTWVTPNSR